MKTIKDLMEKHIKVKIDKRLAFKINKFYTDYTSKYSEFIGGNLIGHEPLYFKTSEVNFFLNSILEIEDRAVRADYKYIDAIVPSRKVTSDVLNLSIVYLIHKFHTGTVSSGIKKTVIMNLLLLFNVKTLSAVHSNSFTYLTTKEVSTAAYEKLSNKFILKQVGSWHAYFVYRANETLKSSSIHTKAIEKFKDDDVLHMIADMQNRVRSFFKLYYRKMLEVNEERSSIDSDGLIISIEGKEHIRDIENDTSSAISATLDSISEGNSYIDKKILDVCTSIYPGVYTEDLVASLKYIIDRNREKSIRNLLEETILHLHNYLMQKGYAHDNKDDLAFLTSKVKGYVSGSRVTDKELVSIRKRYLKIVKKSSSRKAKQYVVALRNSIILYVFIFSSVT